MNANNDGLSRELIRERVFQAGYILRTEKVRYDPDDTPITMVSAYTPEGWYIGPSKSAYQLCKLRGIKPEKAKPTHNVCSIGFSEQAQKWYGWSHRAIFGFGIGHITQEGDCCTTSGYTDRYLAEHPEESLAMPAGFEVKTLDDAKRCAIAFAESVS